MELQQKIDQKKRERSIGTLPDLLLYIWRVGCARVLLTANSTKIFFGSFLSLYLMELLHTLHT